MEEMTDGLSLQLPRVSGQCTSAPPPLPQATPQALYGGGDEHQSLHRASLVHLPHLPSVGLGSSVTRRSWVLAEWQLEGGESPSCPRNCLSPRTRWAVASQLADCRCLAARTYYLLMVRGQGLNPQRTAHLSERYVWRYVLTPCHSRERGRKAGRGELGRLP